MKKNPAPGISEAIRQACQDAGISTGGARADAEPTSGNQAHEAPSDDGVVGARQSSGPPLGAQTPPPALRPTRLLRVDDLFQRGIVRSRMTLWRWVKAGSFPAPAKLPSGVVVWSEAEVERWCRQVFAERDSPKAA